LQPSEFSIAEFVFNVGQIVKYQIDERNVQLKLQIRKENLPSTWRADRERLQQILLNLLLNAVKFTQKGMIVLKVAFKTTTEKKKSLKFTVKDTGVGIDPARIPFIFNLFESNQDSIQMSFIRSN